MLWTASSSITNWAIPAPFCCPVTGNNDRVLWLTFTLTSQGKQPTESLDRVPHSAGSFLPILTHTHTHTHTHTQKRTHTHTRVRPRAHTHTHTHAETHARRNTHTHTEKHTHTMQKHTHTCRNTEKHTHTHRETHTHTHTLTSGGLRTGGISPGACLPRITSISSCNTYTITSEAVILNTTGGMSPVNCTNIVLILLVLHFTVSSLLMSSVNCTNVVLILLVLHFTVSSLLMSLVNDSHVVLILLNFVLSSLLTQSKLPTIS